MRNAPKQYVGQYTIPEKHFQAAPFLIRKSCCYMWCFIIYSTVVRCQTLFPPLNGFLVGDCDNSFGCTCRMRCKDGYNLLGSEILTCIHKPGHLTGHWDGLIPTCKSKQQIIRRPIAPCFHQSLISCLQPVKFVIPRRL